MADISKIDMNRINDLQNIISNINNDISNINNDISNINNDISNTITFEITYDDDTTENITFLIKK